MTPKFLCAMQLAVLGLILSSVPAHAEEVPADLFNKIPWNDHFSPEDFAADYPWINRYYLRQTPVTDILPHWEGNITVTIGFPNKGKAYTTGKTDKIFILDFESNPVAEADQKISQPLEFAIKETAQKLGGIFPHSLTYTPPEKDSKNDPANFRIIVGDGKNWFTAYKIYDEREGSTRDIRQARGIKTLGFPRVVNFDTYEKIIAKAHKFTKNTKNQVDGYFLTSDTGVIDFAVCYIDKHHTPAMLQALTRECLVRGLGFPDIITPQKDSILSNWNNNPPDTPLPHISDSDLMLIKERYSLK